ncbi:hypothetical protein [Candidatus Manganitrophus noduliformans]|uniref:Secreted protein n=1 Tax=Candidatus Manganitrophus noduliformans TaxID=2606439 RepID=A0A7X6DSU4_9BACT|nr:hypothetical protein [Candidatus Manganitrophus noduliformans]NKE72705.1 hypothetical protein [Candidatus Manganitrophus noduliformans]
MRTLSLAFIFVLASIAPVQTALLEEKTAKIVPAGTIVPQPVPPETFSEKPTPVSLRIINQRKNPIYLQGLRQDGERIQIFLYHREGTRGWKPFFEFLPCDLPTCRGLHAPRKSCPKPIPFVIALGPSGSADSFKEVPWNGLLYERSEATREDRKHRYCYKGKVPKTGRMRVEIEFSETLQKESEKSGIIGGRDHAVFEFDLPPSRPSYEIVIEGRGNP